MALDWSIDHGRKLVVATLQRSTTEEEMYRFLGEVIAEGAMPYGKIFDARTATRWITPSRIGPVAATARLYDRMGLGTVGPLAIVVADDAARARAEEFARLSDATRAVRIFGALEPAEAWLAGGENEGLPST
ncbi:MAG: hypothetical protein J0J01_14280 [Reyranella sp.]|uniref:hypothetical protein n=1 Tax=Reyranella sp. TaxID=1929291 RepID=UPI001ACD4BE2|nr:hypothetical protein [Reyranella sp.]MBN9088073.1 hypothetical protein [Reyranella sp.]